jgi:hypothetical protein
MRVWTRFVVAALAILCLAVLCGCGGDGGQRNGGGGGTVTGEIYGAVGGAFVPLGGQQASVGTQVATSQPGTGRFTITNVTPGAFVVVITPQPGYGQVLNPNILNGTVAAGQTVDIGRVLLGQLPPNPAL